MASQRNHHDVVSYSQPEIPEDVIEHIFSFLPLKEVSRLSLVSKRFKYSWKFSRHLSFDRSFARNKTLDELRNGVDDFFSNYKNDAADSFSLYYDATNETTLVSHWIEKAIGLGINQIELDFTLSDKTFILSYNIVNIASLRIMKLVNCELDLPLYSNGLRHLREITFQDMRAQPVMIQSIFSNCLSLRAMKLVKCTSVFSFGAMSNALQILVLKDCQDVQSIGIISPALRSFHYHGKITEFNAYCDLQHLSDVILDIAHPRNFQLLLHRKEVMNSLSHVRTLTVTSTFLEGLGARYNGSEYKDVEFFLWKLQEFHLIVAPESFLNPSDILIFLKKCRYVERVFIDLRKNALGNSFYWNNYGKKYLEESQIVFPFLKHVRITGFTMRELPVSMARYFLKNAVRLRCLMIVKARIHQCPEFYNLECLRLGIISNATIEIYEHNRYRSAIMPEHSGHL